jgi:hypothetical protein
MTMRTLADVTTGMKARDTAVPTAMNTLANMGNKTLQESAF